MSNNNYKNKPFVAPQKRSFPAMKATITKQTLDYKARGQEFCQQVRMRCEAFLEGIIKAGNFLEEMEVTTTNYVYDVGREKELFIEKKKKKKSLLKNLHQRQTRAKRMMKM